MNLGLAERPLVQLYDLVDRKRIDMAIGSDHRAGGE
jgi:hypothetical protein